MVKEKAENLRKFMQISERVRFLTVAQICEGLSITRRTLDRWSALGLGPPRMRIQRLILYRPEDITAWLQNHLERRQLSAGPVRHRPRLTPVFAEEAKRDGRQDSN